MTTQRVRKSTEGGMTSFDVNGVPQSPLEESVLSTDVPLTSRVMVLRGTVTVITPSRTAVGGPHLPAMTTTTSTR
jgi:hypothetical protein